MDATKLNQPVRDLEYPDRFFYQAAEGWLELGNPEQAEDELNQLTAAGRAHPDALHLRWRVLASTNRWQSCLIVSRALTVEFPSDARSWITFAETFYRMGEVQKAYRIASANAADFPESWTLLYDAACYACLVGKFREAQGFFELALCVGDEKSIRRTARNDPDLEPIWTCLSSASPAGKKAAR